MLPQLIALQVITFIALALLLKMLFSRHLDSALKRLKKLQRETLMRENQLNEELDLARQERQAQVESGKAEAKALIDQAKKDIKTMRAGAEEEAKQQNKKIFAQGREEIETIKAKMLSDIENKALSIAVELISYTFSQKGREDLQRQFIDELIGEIESLSKDKFSVKTHNARVLTSFPLTDKEKDKLKKVLAGKMGLTVAISEETEPNLIAGLVVKLGAMEIDGSLKNRLRKALPLIKDNSNQVR